jgi:hypothetical protein
MPNQLSVHRFVSWAALLSGIFFVSMLAFFFFNLGTTTSQYSVGGVTAPHQFFHNFMNGRLFQTSLYATKLAGDSVGFSYNPYAHLHTYAIHVYLTPFVFAPLWNLWPSLPWLYGVVFLVNYGGMALFAWKTLQYLSPQSFKIKMLAAIGLLMSSGFLFTFQQNAQLLMFSGPFALAAFYFLLTRQRAKFLLSLMLLCLTSEDAAMVAVTFCFYIYLFEKDARSYALLGGALAIAYLVLVLLIIQPAARSELVLSGSTTTMVVLKHILNFDPSAIGVMLIGFAPVLFFLPAFGIAYLLFGKPDISWVQIAALVLIAPLPHWGESAIVGASHHLMPVVVFTFAAFVFMLGRTTEIQSNAAALPGKKAAMLFCVSAIFVAGSLRVMISNLPEQMLLPLYNLAGKQEKAQKVERSLSERSGNRRAIDVVERIPKESSLVYLTNSSVEGFIAGRSDIWRFPDYYDLVDYLVLQPNAHQSFFSFPVKDNQSLAQALTNGRYVGTDNAEISEETVNAIVRHLVAQEKSHRVIVDEPEVVLLERIERHQMYSPPSTIGLGWVPNVFHSRGVAQEKNR